MNESSYKTGSVGSFIRRYDWHWSEEVNVYGQSLLSRRRHRDRIPEPIRVTLKREVHL